MRFSYRDRIGPLTFSVKHVFLKNTVISLVDRKNGLTQHQGVNILLNCAGRFGPEFSPLSRLTLGKSATCFGGLHLMFCTVRKYYYDAI
jgi:hypothetical protein